MTAREILEEWLKAHGYDGLCTTDCGCHLGDLAPCGESCVDCQPGYKVKPPPSWPGPDAEFIIMEEKP